MASFTDIAPIATKTGRFEDRIRNLRARYEQWRMYRDTVNELQALTNRELNDLGLHRGEIRGVALNAAYGEPR